MPDPGTLIVSICGLVVTVGVTFNTLMNRRFEVRQGAFDDLQKAYDAVVVELRQAQNALRLAQDRNGELQNALVQRMVHDQRPYRGGGET